MPPAKLWVPLSLCAPPLPVDCPLHSDQVSCPTPLNFKHLENRTDISLQPWGMDSYSVCVTNTLSASRGLRCSLSRRQESIQLWPTNLKGQRTHQAWVHLQTSSKCLLRSERMWKNGNTAATYWWLPEWCSHHPSCSFHLSVWGKEACYGVPAMCQCFILCASRNWDNKSGRQALSFPFYR